MFSLVPVVIHYYGQQVNPFLFSVVAYSTLGIILIMYLRLRSSSLFRDDLRLVGVSTTERITTLTVLKYVLRLDEGERPIACALPQAIASHADNECHNSGGD